MNNLAIVNIFALAKKVTNIKFDCTYNIPSLIIYFSESKDVSKKVCTTDSGPNPNEPCVFPFTYSDGKTHHSCTFDYGNPTDPAWCSTKVRIKKLLICTKLDLIRPISNALPG